MEVPKQKLYCEKSGQHCRVYCKGGIIPKGGSTALAAAGMVEICSPPFQATTQPRKSTGPDLRRALTHTNQAENLWVDRDTGVHKVPGIIAEITVAKPPPPPPPAQPSSRNSRLVLMENFSNSKYRVRSSDLVLLMKRFLICLTNGLPYSRDWFRIDKLQEVSHTGLLFDNALRQFRSEINDMTGKELYDLQTKGFTLNVYSAGSSGQIKKVYWSTKESVFMLLDLLHFQFNSDLEEAKQFLKTVYGIFEKTSGKQNCLCLIGPANCGKNFFVDGVCDFSLNPGKMERSHNCAFSSCHNRRVIKWDECNFDRSYDETVLNLLKGKPFLANIKFRNPEPVYRTPVFVMANTHPFALEPRFDHRVVRVDWEVCNRLRKYKEKQPYPLAHGQLLIRANGLLNEATDKTHHEMWDFLTKRYNKIHEFVNIL